MIHPITINYKTIIIISIKDIISESDSYISLVNCVFIIYCYFSADYILYFNKSN